MTGSENGATQPAEPEHSNTLSPEESSPIPTDITAACLEAIEQFEAGSISKWEAISQVFQALEADSESAISTPEQRARAGESYLEMLENHENQLAKAQARGQALQHQNQSKPSRRGSGSVSDGENEHHKRSRSPSFDDESPTKKPRFNESLYAWRIADEINPVSLSPTLEHTLQMVRNHTADIKHALWSLLGSRSVLPFPKSEWKNVLVGTAVNLDAVFTGSFSTISDDKTTAALGSFELAFGSSKPSKTVQTHGDWVIAWNATSAATRFVYPHRANELEQYTQYLIQFFGAFPPSCHGKVINLDKAIRKYCGEVRNIELSEFGRFRHLEARYLQSDGLGASTGHAQKEKMEPRRSPESCRQWNDGICHRRASECRYRHVCSGCGGRHRKSECSKKD
jgi:hypothetical protein